MEKLKELRIAKGKTQIQVAKEIGVSLYAYQLWERGVTTPNDINMYKLKKIFNLK